MGRDVGISRECNDRDIARAGKLAHWSDGERKQRPENDLRPFIKCLLRRLLRPGSSAPVVLDDELNIRAVEFRKRHLGGVAHGLRSHGGVPGCGERQDETGLDLAGADVGRRLRGGAAGELDSRSLTEKLPEQPASSTAPMTAATQRIRAPNQAGEPAILGTLGPVSSTAPTMSPSTAGCNRHLPAISPRPEGKG